MTEKRLYKARGQRMVCGVCGGVAEYFGIDPTLVRLAFLLLAAGWGSGLLAYIVAAIIIPEPPADPYR
ncbi:MAG: PspC domain-containing protein [Ruthenibacterium sp.]|jgi:phage shock protein C, pspC|nr:PspC domain-containing protein [Oscillospiraceae bacterium]